MTPTSDVALAPFCTMGVGGPARWFVSAATETDICDALRWAEARDMAVHVLGGGSNVIVADEGLGGLVIKVDLRGVEVSNAGGQVVHEVAAGEPWDRFVATTVQADYAGLECLSGIPGLAGGTPIQNVGAYGQEVADVIGRVHAIDRSSISAVSFSNAECVFGYRTSRFKSRDVDRFVVTRVEYALTPGGRATVTYADVVTHFERAGIERPGLEAVRGAIIDIRRRKGMVIDDANPARRSCGSFFVNPVVPLADLAAIQARWARDTVPHYVVDASTVKIPAAWLIERSGFKKGFTCGSVGISPFQAQAIVNLGGASAAEVLALACDVKRAVWDTFGISLVAEPVFVGFGSSPELRFLCSLNA